jgi:hypothetical protein
MPKAKKDLPYQPSGEVRRIVSLANGTWAYITDELGKLHHLEVSSQDFLDKCLALDENFGGRATRELTTLGWTDVLDRLKNSGESE